MQSTVIILISGFVFSALALPAPVPKDDVDTSVKQSIPSAAKSEEPFSIANWHAPPEIATKFPFYLSGYDNEDRPIGIIELGKWDARAWFKKGKEAWADLNRHAEKMLYILKSGIHARNTTDDNGDVVPVTDELGLIIDFDGLNVAQVTTPQVLQFMTKYLGQLESLQHRISYAYFINVNAVASVIVRVLRPVLGSVFERIEVFGTQKKQWMPVLRRNLPEDQIPEKYGGKAGHKPLVFYG
jgi:hypothetical protein